VRITKKLLKISALLIPMALSACGDGWQVVYTKDVFPYGDGRTAGVGVIYVREIMMPAKELKLVDDMPKVEEQEAVASGLTKDEMFKNHQMKSLNTRPQSKIEKAFIKAQSK
tara:strand:- start:69301 stop:69636 length:336 start_codon:yes stop_codon:yes gene_type:complete